MIKDDLQHDGKKKPADKKRKTYKKPRILSVEKLEVVAASCEGSKEVFTGTDNCGTSSPLNS